MNIELQKPPPEAKGFEPGDRIIVVDNVRWGRTLVSRHGVWGTKYQFEQEGGETIINVVKDRAREIAVRSIRKRSYDQDPVWRPTHELVLDKVRELIEAGKLRHPDVVKAEQAAARARYKARVAENERAEQAAFEAKAREALQINQQ